MDSPSLARLTPRAFEVTASRTLSMFIVQAESSWPSGLSRQSQVRYSVSVLPPLNVQGMTMFYNENRGEELWVPSGTSAQSDKAYVEQYYSGSNTRLEQFMLSEASQGDVLQPAAFDAAYAIHKQVLEVEALNPKDNTTMLTWDNYCLKRGDTCLEWNVLSLFGYDETSWQTNEDILNRLNMIVPAAVATSDSDEQCATSDGGFEITQMLGGITYSADGKINGAKLLSFGYLLQNNLELTSDNAEVDPRVSHSTPSLRHACLVTER